MANFGPEGTHRFTPTGYEIIPDPLAKFPLLRRGEMVSIGGKLVSIDPGTIIRSYRAHADSPLSEIVNCYQPEFYFAKAMNLALMSIAPLWKLDGREAVTSWRSTLYHGRVVQAVCDIPTADKGRFRLVATYPDFLPPGYLSTEEVMDAYKKGYLSDIDAGGVWLGKINEAGGFDDILAVISPELTRGDWPWFGSILTDTKKYEPGYTGRLAGVSIEEAQGLTTYIEKVLQTIQ